MRCIANTTVLSNFASINQLEVLRRLFSTIAISVEVYEEIQSGKEQGYDFYIGIEQIIFPFAQDGWIHMVSMTDDRELCMFSTLPSRLHYGEASCIAIAYYRGWLFLTDDRSARQQALQRGLQLSGSVGCLIVAVERGVCSLEQANRWLEEMKCHGYFAPVADLASLIHNT